VFPGVAHTAVPSALAHATGGLQTIVVLDVGVAVLAQHTSPAFGQSSALRQHPEIAAHPPCAPHVGGSVA
jgi:hypothetical protein